MQELSKFDRAFPRQAAHGGLPGVRRAPEATGTPVVILPGASGTSEFFMTAAPLLAKAGLDPIFVDYPGAMPPDALCRATEAQAREMGLRDPFVLGCSYSAYWLQHLRADSVFRAVILANGFVDADDLKGNPLFDHAAISATAPDELSRQWLGRIAAQPDTPLKRMLTVGLAEWLKPEDLRGRLLQVSSAPPIASAFAGPVAVLDSTEDAIVDADARSRFRSAWPEADHIDVPGGHYPYVTRPDRFAQTVIWWVGNILDKQMDAVAKN